MSSRRQATQLHCATADGSDRPIGNGRPTFPAYRAFNVIAARRACPPPARRGVGIFRSSGRRRGVDVLGKVAAGAETDGAGESDAAEELAAAEEGAVQRAPSMRPVPSNSTADGSLRPGCGQFFGRVSRAAVVDSV
jgi:nucleoid-associated protein YgaU